MAVYDLNGEALEAVYDVEGNELSSVFDTEGNEIPVHDEPYPLDYSQYTITDLFTYADTVFNGFDVYGNKLFNIRADSQICIFNLSTETLLERVSVSAGHGDSASFSNEKYDSADLYPLLYVTTDYTPAEVRVVRIMNGSTSVVKKLVFPSSVGYYGGGVYDFANGLCYILAYKEQDYLSSQSGANKTIVTIWDLTDLTDNGDDTFTPAYVDGYERDFIYCMQGMQFHDGYIWIASGFNQGTNQYVYAMKPDTGVIDYTIELDDTIEIEGCAWVFDEEENKYWMLVGQQNGSTGVNYSKIEFPILESDE